MRTPAQTRPWAVFSFRAFAFFLALSGLSACMCDLQGPECRHNRDCPISSVCLAGWCRPEGEIVCQLDGSCPQGMRCSQGVCAPKAVSCKTNQDCPSTEECRVLVCQPKTPPACTKDADCPEKQTCAKDTCTPVTPACTKDADCETGSRCEQGKCVSTAQSCKEDSHCLAGQSCVSGVCQASGICLSSKFSHTVATNLPLTLEEIYALKGGTEILDVNETSLRLRDTKTGQWKQWWTFAKDGATPLIALSPSERWLVRATTELKLWDLSSENPPQTLALKASAIHLGDQVLSTIEKSRLARYSVLDLTLQSETPLPADLTKSGSFYHPAFDPHGATFAFFTPEGLKGRVTIVESATMKILHTLAIPEKIQFAFAYKLGFSTTGRYLWAVGLQHWLVWDLQTPASLPKHFSPITHSSGGLPSSHRITFHPQDTHFALLLSDQSATIYQLPEGIEAKGFPTTPETTLLRYAPDGHFYLATKGGTLSRRDEQGKHIAEYQARFFPTSMVSPINRPALVRSVTEDGVIREWDLSTQAFRVWLVPSDGKKILYRDLLLSPDGRFVLDFFPEEPSPGKPAGLVEQWEVEPSLRKLRTLRLGPVYSPRAFSPDGRFFVAVLPDFVSAYPENKIGLWDLHTGEALPPLDVRPAVDPTKDSLFTLAVSPGASYVVAASNAQGTAALWDRKNGSVRPLHGSQGPRLRGLVFAPDGETFAGLNDYDHIDIFSSKTGAIQRSLPIPFANYLRLAYSPDGTFLAGDGGAGHISVWETKTGKPVFTYSLGKDAAGKPIFAYHLFFASSGRRFFFAPPGEFSAWDCP